MGQLIRARQRAITAILPHPGNTKILVPSRFGMIPDQAPAFNTTGVIMEFAQPVSGTAVSTGFTVYVDGVSLTIGLVTQPNINFIRLAYPLQIVGDLASVEYDGSGDWAGANGFVVGIFGQAGTVK